MWRNIMKALITGHKGFVGRHFVKKLETQGWDITGVDIVDENPVDARDFFRKDNTHYDLVVHLAAVVGGRATIEGAPLSVAVDLAIDSEAFQWALRTKPKHFVYYSSSAAYPIWMQEEKDNSIWAKLNTHKLKEEDIDLNDIANPDFTYGWSKLTGEMLASYAEREGLRVHVFRPFSGYGSDQDLDYPFPSFIARAKRKDNPFEVWGDGTQVRDWIHIDDIVDATMAAVTEDVKGPINLCSGRPTSFNELAELVSKEAGYSPRLDHKLGAPKGVHYRVGDPTRLNRFYLPKISIEEGIRRALNN
jgi:nucleoside-diphosphate-sugar epimerase